MAVDFRTNPKFKERVLAYFDQADKNKDGLLLMSEVLEFAENAKKLTGKNDAEMESLRETLREFYGRCGVTETGIKRDDWVEHLGSFAVEDLKMMKEEGSEKTLMYKVNRAWFDTFDINKDGVLSKDEFVKIGQCSGLGDAYAAIFATADTNHNGFIEWDEYFNLMCKFWFELEQDNMYGGQI